MLIPPSVLSRLRLTVDGALQHYASAYRTAYARAVKNDITGATDYIDRVVVPARGHPLTSDAPLLPRAPPPIRAIKSGELEKLGGTVKNWKRRFSVLRSDGVFSYYTAPVSQGGRLRGRFSVHGYDVLSCSGDLPFMIELRAPGRRAWAFSFPDPETRDAWACAFRVGALHVPPVLPYDDARAYAYIMAFRDLRWHLAHRAPARICEGEEDGLVSLLSRVLVRDNQAELYEVLPAGRGRAGARHKQLTQISSVVRAAVIKTLEEVEDSVQLLGEEVAFAVDSYSAEPSSEPEFDEKVTAAKMRTTAALILPAILSATKSLTESVEEVLGEVVVASEKTTAKVDLPLGWLQAAQRLDEEFSLPSHPPLAAALRTVDELSVLDTGVDLDSLRAALGSALVDIAQRFRVTLVAESARAIQMALAPLGETLGAGRCLVCGADAGQCDCGLVERDSAEPTDENALAARAQHAVPRRPRGVSVAGAGAIFDNLTPVFSTLRCKWQAACAVTEVNVAKHTVYSATEYLMSRDAAADGVKFFGGKELFALATECVNLVRNRLK